jgi:WD40 repeat protein
MTKIKRQSKQKPVIFLVFANDKVHHTRYLRNLAKEKREIRTALEKAKQAGLCDIVVRSSASVEDILDMFQDYKDRIAIFHYGGHADCYKLLLESVTGARSFAFKEGLVSFFSRQKSLKLIFLNACSTKQHAEELIQKGIPAVIGTFEEIEDQAATGLAIRFYKGIARGLTLERAWQEAEDEIKIRKGPSNLNAVYHYSQQGKHPDCFPWEIFFKEGAKETKEAKDWNLPGTVNDFLFGLPPIPSTYKLPDKPFLFLERYQRKHAEVFFGRSYYTRGLYSRVIDKNSPPIILLYGQSGAGKSSLLEAGLLPRLEESHNIIYTRRDRDKGLLETLNEKFLEVSEPFFKKVLTRRRQSTDLAEKWKEIETRTGKPLLVILDQVEEVITHPNKNLAGELGIFLEALISLFGNPMIYPGGKLILGYRKEYHPEIDKQLGMSELDRTPFFLQPLDREDIIEVVTGLTCSQRLKDKYNLEVEDQLPGIIADDLLEDNDSPVAPTLQIVLTKMWDKSRPAGSLPVRRFRTEQYRTLKKEGLLMEDFFKQQMEELKNWETDVVDSGLALDVLKFHTTGLGTARTRDIEEIRQAYSHTRDKIDDLVKQLKQRYLLTDTQDDKKETTLAHDTLAPVVIKEYNESDKPGQQASRIIAARIEDFKKNPGEVWLNEADLKMTERGRRGMRVLDDEEKKLLERSGEREERRQRQMKKNKMVGRILMISILLLIFAAIVIYQWKEAAKQKIIKANYLAAQAQSDAAKDPTAALCLAVQARQLRENDITTGALFKIYRENIFYKIIGRLKQDLKSAAFSGDGRYIIADFYDETSRAWNLQGKELTGVKRDKVIAARSVSSRENQNFFTGSNDGTILLWDLKKYKIQDFVGHEGRFYSHAFSPNGKYVLTGSEDKTARLWDLQGNKLQVFRGHEGSVTSVAFSPDSRYILTGSRDTLRLWEFKDKELKCFVGHRDEVHSVVFSRDSKYILTGSKDETVGLWNREGKKIRIFKDHESSVNSIAVSPEGKHVVAGCKNGTLRLWDLKGKEVWAIKGHKAGVSSVVFSPDGQKILTASYDKTFRLWDLKGNELQDFQKHKHRVTSAVFSPDGQYIVTGSYDRTDKTARLWDLEGNELTVFQGQRRCVTSVAFSPGGEFVLTGSFDKTARLWDLQGNELQVFKGHRGIIHSVNFSPDGKYVLTGSSDKTARLWDLKGNQLQIFKGHEGVVHSAVFSPNGKNVLTGSFDGTARLWKINKVEDFLKTGGYSGYSCLAPCSCI